jgi:hypothetical protein
MRVDHNDWGLGHQRRSAGQGKQTNLRESAELWRCTKSTSGVRQQFITFFQAIDFIRFLMVLRRDNGLLRRGKLTPN